MSLPKAFHIALSRSPTSVLVMWRDASRDTFGLKLIALADGTFALAYEPFLNLIEGQFLVETGLKKLLTAHFPYFFSIHSLTSL